MGYNKRNVPGGGVFISADEASRNDLEAKQKECEKIKKQMELALDAGDLGYWDWDLKTGKAFFNATAHRMMGYEPGDVPSTMDAWMALIHPDDRQALIKRIQYYVVNDQPKPEEFRMRCKNGAYKWFSVKGKTYERENDNTPVRALGVLYDVDKKKKEEHMRILIENIPTQVWYLTSPKTYGAVNTAHADFLGLSKEKIEFRDVDKIFPKSVAKRIIDHNVDIFQKKESKKTEVIFPNYLGEERLLLINQTPKVNEEGLVEYLVCSAEDVTEQHLAEKKLKESHEAYKKLSEKLHKASITDELTGLPNRRGFNRQLEKEWKRTRRNNQSLTLMISDLDYFKYYNDSKGHLEGDKLLQNVANTVKSVFKRPGDYFARYGGDEFVAIIPDTDLEGVLKLAEECRKSVAKLKIPNTSAPDANHITISIGFATSSPADGTSDEELMKEADRALYRAKSKGRNKIEYARI